MATQRRTRVRRREVQGAPEAKVDEIEQESPLISVQEAATLLRISRSTAYDLVKRGEFPVTVIRIGTQWRVNRVELEDLIGGRRAAS